MRGCLSSSQTDGTEESFRMSLRSLLATKETPMSGASVARKIIERKFGIGTRKTLQARTTLLDSACHDLSKAKQRTFLSLIPSNYIKSEILLFPLPLPPGYSPSTESISSPKPRNISSRKLLTSRSSSSLYRVIGSDDFGSSTSASRRGRKPDCLSSEFSFSSTSPRSPDHSSCGSSANSPFRTCPEVHALASPTSSSSVFSASSSSLSQSSSTGSSSSSVFLDSRSHSLNRRTDRDDNNITCSPAAFLPSPQSGKNRSASVLREFAPVEIAKACKQASTDLHKLFEGAMGPIFEVFLPTEKCNVALARVQTKLSRKQWRAQVEECAQLDHSNLSRVIGFCYERAKYGSIASEDMSQNTCFIVYKDIGEQSLKEFLEDIEKGIDWYIRLKIATGVAEGLSFLLDRIPNQVSYGSLTLDNIRIDSALNVKLLDFVFLSTQTVYLKEKQHHSLVNSLGNMLLQLFGFLNPPEDGGAAGAGRRCNINKLYPQKDAKVVIDLAASCLLPEPSLCPSIRHVARVLQSIEPTKHVAKYAINRSKSFAYSKTRSLSFG